MPDQAQLNPMLYVQGLAGAADGELDNLSIFENSRVTEVIEKDGGVTVETENTTVVAKFAIHATHTPKGIKAVQMLLGPYREYGVAYKTEGHFPEGIFWGYHSEGRKFSFRRYERNGDRFVMVIGEPHKVGQVENNKTSIKSLEEFALKHFDLKESTGFLRVTQYSVLGE